MGKERIESLKFMRVMAMLLVVLIHATAVAITTLDADNKFYPLYMLLNRFTRFEGSIFVFLSGVVLFYNYESRPFTSGTWLEFYKKRFMYILVPYVVWSLFYEVYSYTMGYRSYEGIGVILSNLLNGHSFYQLYFILILVQLYFLLPIFIYLIKRFPFIRNYLFVLGFLLEFVYALVNRKYGLVTYPLFTVYVASFLLGGWVGIHYQKVKDVFTKNIFRILLFVTIGLGVLYTVLFYYQYMLKQPLLSYPSYKALGMVYFLLACYFLFKSSIWLEKNVSTFTNQWVERLRIYSFGFYLVHPFILDIWERVLVSKTSHGFHILIFVRYGLVVICCYLFIRAIHRLFPQAWMIFGKLPKIDTK